MTWKWWTNEYKCSLISIRGLALKCTVHPTCLVSDVTKMPPYNRPFSSVQTGDTVFVITSTLPVFIQHGLRKISPSARFTLVTGCSVWSVSRVATRQRLLQDARVELWFAQNCDITHPKLRHVPLGIDFHSGSQGKLATNRECTLQTVAGSAKSISERKINVLCDFHFAKYGDHGRDRHVAEKALRRHTFCTFPAKKLPRSAFWKLMAAHSFVASPHGKGLDCHRTYEALVLGCIPIVRSSSLDHMYDGLPVLIVDRWGDVTLQRLTEFIAEMSDGAYDLAKLTRSYWWGVVKMRANDQVQNGSSSKDAMRPFMHTDEIAMFDKYVTSGVRYGEYGAGGSTVQAVNNGAKSVVFVESSQQWISMVKDSIGGRGDVTPIYVDIAADDKNFGNPKNTSKKRNWPLYSAALNNRGPFDVVLVDGRFRVACALSAHKMLKESNGILVVHDYTNRPHYHLIGRYYTKIDSVRTLAVFRPTKDLSVPPAVISRFACDVR